MLKAVMIFLVKLWQWGPSRILPPTCRYQPTCSAYMIKAIETNYNESNSINENFSIVKQFYDYDRISKKCVNFLLELIDERIKILNSIFGNVATELHNMRINQEDIFLDNLSKEITSISQKSK